MSLNDFKTNIKKTDKRKSLSVFRILSCPLLLRGQLYINKGFAFSANP